MMNNSVAGFAVLAAMAMSCGTSYAAGPVQSSGKTETVSKPVETTSTVQKPLAPKRQVKHHRGGRNWLNPQPEPPAPLAPDAKLWLNPQPEPPAPLAPDAKLWLNPQPEPPAPLAPDAKLWLNPQPEPPKPPEPTLIK
ncbi:MAG: hypothetical protein HGB20_00200 [Chlorobiaceae bacterium]|nr:hypothetical protein [Chlorobiaceae bacterium]